MIVQYLNGALAAEGLYSEEFGGLWLGGNYAGRDWMLEPRTKRTHMGATAKAVAAFLTHLFLFPFRRSYPATSG